MKTNFLCRNALPRGAGVFLKLGLSVMILTLFCLSGYAQEQHVYLKLHKNHDGVPDQIKIEPLSDVVGEDLSYCYYGNVDDETVTLRLFEGSEDGFHAQLTLMNHEPSLFIRFGVSIGDFKRTYSLNNNHLDVNLNNIPRLYYDKGHVEVSQNGEIDIYYDGNFYQVHYNDIINGTSIVECEEVCKDVNTNCLSGLREAFVSTYGRLNTGGEVNFMFRPWQPSDYDSLGECVVCKPDDERPVSFETPPTCDITLPDCQSGNRLETDIQQGYIKAYPNPANHQITLEVVPVSDEVITINIVDGLGRIVQHRSESVLQNNEHIFHFDVSQLTPGIYYIEIDSEYRFEAQKITIIK